jgi:hypothetical protein
MVCIEYTNAYTDGSSRHERAFAPWLPDRDARMAALLDALESPDDAGVEVDRASTKLRLERAMDARWADWWRWHTTRVEAAARGMASAAITALSNRENAAWVAYAQVINEWRLA